MKIRIEDSGTRPLEHTLYFDFEDDKYSVMIAGLKRKDLGVLMKKIKTELYDDITGDDTDEEKT